MRLGKVQIIGRHFWVNGVPAEIGQMHPCKPTSNSRLKWVGLTLTNGRRDLVGQASDGREVWRVAVARDGCWEVSDSQQEVVISGPAVIQAKDLFCQAFGLPTGLPLQVNESRNTKRPPLQSDCKEHRVGRAIITTSHRDGQARPKVERIEVDVNQDKDDDPSHRDLLLALSEVVTGGPVGMDYVEMLLSGDPLAARSWVKSSFSHDPMNNSLSELFIYSSTSALTDKLAFPLFRKPGLPISKSTEQMFAPLEFLASRVGGGDRHRGLIEIFGDWLSEEQRECLLAMSQGVDSAASAVAKHFYLYALEQTPAQRSLRWLKKTRPYPEAPDFCRAWDDMSGHEDMRLTMSDKDWQREAMLWAFRHAHGQAFVDELFARAEPVVLPPMCPVFDDFVVQHGKLYGERRKEMWSDEVERRPLGLTSRVFPINIAELAEDIAAHGSWLTEGSCGAHYISGSTWIWGALALPESTTVYTKGVSAVMEAGEAQTAWVSLWHEGVVYPVILVLSAARESSDTRIHVVAFGLQRTGSSLQVLKTRVEQEFQAPKRSSMQQPVVFYR